MPRTIHPAGQAGVNPALRGRGCVELVVDPAPASARRGKDIGQHLYLRRYESVAP